MFDITSTKNTQEFHFQKLNPISYMIYIMVKFPMSTNTLNYFLKCYNTRLITNFMGHNLTIIVMQILIFMGLYEIDMDVIHLLVLFEHWWHVHCLCTNVICIFVLFKHGCRVSLCCLQVKVVHTIFMFE